MPTEQGVVKYIVLVSNEALSSERLNQIGKQMCQYVLTIIGKGNIQHAVFVDDKPSSLVMLPVSAQAEKLGHAVLDNSKGSLPPIKTANAIVDLFVQKLRQKGIEIQQGGPGRTH